MFDKDNKFGFISNNNNESNNIEGLDNIKTDINNIKSDVNELNTQYKDIAKYNGKHFSTIKIAASDSSDKDKVIADVVCDGVNDAEEINQAIQDLNTTGGKIILANGHYYIDTLTSYSGRKYGIYFPDSRAEIIIEGITHVHKYENTSLNLNDVGAIIEMTQTCYDSIGSSDVVSLVGGHPE
mgnify:CR=1 FL=1